MQTTTMFTPTSRRRRRPRAAPQADLLRALDREEQAARQLTADLAALIRAELIVTAGAGNELRFAVVEPGGVAA